MLNPRIPIAFEVATPLEVCKSFSKSLDRPVKYKLGRVRFHVPVPSGYKEHLLALEKTLGSKQLNFDQAPYFGPTMFYPNEAIELWEGNRGLEEYSQEAFLVEERINGQTWMDDDDDVEDGNGDDSEEVGSKDSTCKSHNSYPDAMFRRRGLTKEIVSERPPCDAETL